MNRHFPIFRLLYATVVAVAFVSCGVTRFVPEDEHLLDHVAIESDGKDLDVKQFDGYIRQHPNTRWFNLVRVPMLPYSISGTDSTKRVNRFLHRVGQAPVIYDEHKTELTRQDIEHAARGLGYLGATVDVREEAKGKKLKLDYVIHPGERYYVNQLHRVTPDDSIALILRSNEGESLLTEGMPFDINQLDQERQRISSVLRNQGYFAFGKENVHFRADTTQGNHQVRLAQYVDTRNQRPFHIGEVVYNSDSIGRRNALRWSMLRNKVRLKTGNLFREKDLQDTYDAMGSLSAILSNNIQMMPNPADSSLLDAHITVATVRRHTFNMEIEGTNSAGDLGAAVSFGYNNRNLTRRSETLNFKVRGAYEAIRGLSGYEDQDYIEYGAEFMLSFPDFKVPFLSRALRRRFTGLTDVLVRYDSQDRPEFHRRVVSAALRYRWHTPSRRMQHRLDVVDVNYVFMPWISPTFRRDYLDNASSRNAVLRYNYENLFIMKLGYSLSWGSHAPGAATTGSGSNAWNLRLNLESAGNLLYGASKLFHTQQNSEGYYSLFDIAYAQYAKVDIDYSKSFRLDNANSLAFHFSLGLAYPYGNSKVLPFEKRYFSGGANSVRGWSVRELGPGTFSGSDGRVDFIRQTGDIKIDLSMEYRTHLFWLIDGAAFVDAGNIWTFRNYAEQPGGQFHFRSFWREIAVAYGLGVRFNFNYFILRLDGGMKAVNPAYEDSKGHFPIVRPNFKRDFALHFAVGLPF